jgi:HNH endonuclease
VELDGKRDGARDAAWAAIEQAVIGKAVDLLSGPGGLASFLRRRQLGARPGGPSLPLDIGYAETIPAGIRNAVKLRDKHCQRAGRRTQPASACEVHHTKHKANGGTTSVKDCVLLCSFHHQVVIHRAGPDRQPGRHHHGVEQGQDQGAAQPRTPGPAGVTPRN